MTNFSDNLTAIFDLFLLLLIGMGPKIALVPFLDLTQSLDVGLQRRVAKQMVRTAVGTAIVLVIFGSLLMQLLHFTPGAASVAGGIVLLLLALNMLVSPAKKEQHEHPEGRDPMQLAVYPLAVPYLLNPSGIAVLVTESSLIESLIDLAIMMGVILLVGLFDWWVFSNMKHLAKYLKPSRLVVTEVVFGVLLTALAVQLMVDGLVDLGILETATTPITAGITWVGP
jgi:multiple antibiotic resistance protein